MTAGERIAVALDVPELTEAEELARRLAGHVGWFKVGLELFSAHGPEAVRTIRKHGPVFLDVKLHDIPTTVARAARRLADLDVGLLTVHASGGPAMVAAAADGLGSTARVLAVTVLTSLSRTDVAAIGLAEPDAAAHLARLAVDSGAGGVVCAPDQATMVRDAVGSAPWIVTPGVRPQGSDDDDHASVATPAEAIAAGADLLVIGRPITRADDPVAAADDIAASLAR
ncbi:MAG: orotidine-5'-phosphate decarboxylase [Nitriliruptoraceae bacterium]